MKWHCISPGKSENIRTSDVFMDAEYLCLKTHTQTHTIVNIYRTLLYSAAFGGKLWELPHSAG